MSLSIRSVAEDVGRLCCDTDGDVYQAGGPGYSVQRLHAHESPPRIRRVPNPARTSVRPTPNAPAPAAKRLVPPRSLAPPMTGFAGSTVAEGSAEGSRTQNLLSAADTPRTHDPAGAETGRVLHVVLIAVQENITTPRGRAASPPGGA